MHLLALGLLLAPLFTDHAVLQRDRPVPIWGRANPGEKLSVEFAGQRRETAADARGRWTATLAPMAATGIGSDLVVRGATKVTVHDIVVGDVWLCAGQSNMEFPPHRDQAGSAEVAADREGSGYRVRFVHCEGLKTHRGTVEGFAVAGVDRVFQPAQARIEGESVRVWNAAILRPEAIRYAWSNSPQTDLFNGTDLPAAPFRSDRR